MHDFDSTVQVDTSLLRLDAHGVEDRQRSPCLIAVSGPHRGAIFTLRGAEVVLGRTSECQILLTDVGISRRHAIIHVDGANQLTVRDLGSRNGILVNGEKVAERVLLDGDTLELGEATKLVVTWADSAQQMILRSQYDLATRDALTGCFRNHYFMEQLHREWLQSARNAFPLSLLFIDVDFFKKVNDAHGHAVGDEVLKQLGALLMNVARKSDVVARYGGEEFVVLLPNTDRTTARAAAERLRVSLADASLMTEAGPLHVTMSIGISCNTEHHISSPEDLQRSADARLYQAKGNGRNRVEADFVG